MNCYLLYGVQQKVITIPWKNCALTTGIRLISVKPATTAEKFVDNCPKPVQPYLKLMRIDKPIGNSMVKLVQKISS